MAPPPSTGPFLSNWTAQFHPSGLREGRQSQDCLPAEIGHPKQQGGQNPGWSKFFPTQQGGAAGAITVAFVEANLELMSRPRSPTMAPSSWTSRLRNPRLISAAPGSPTILRKSIFDYRACKGRWDRHSGGVYTNTSNGSGCSLPLQASSRMAIQNKTTLKATNC